MGGVCGGSKGLASASVSESVSESGTIFVVREGGGGGGVIIN